MISKNPLTQKDWLDRYELGRTSYFDTKKIRIYSCSALQMTAKAWAKFEFKGGDGNIKICPKQFYQVLNLYLFSVLYFVPSGI